MATPKDLEAGNGSDPGVTEKQGTFQNLAPELTIKGVTEDSEALSPDPGSEHLFEVENNPFAFTPGQLGKLLNPKSLGAFYALGGLGGFERGLRTNRTSGLSIDETVLEGGVSFYDATGTASNGAATKTPTTPTTSTTSESDAFVDRKRVFNDNRLPAKKAKSIWELAWIAYNDKVLILLTVAAIISLALGLYQTFGQEHEPGEAKVEWVEGVAIIVAILIVVVVGTLNDYQKERQFIKLNRKKDDRKAKCIRSGRTMEISVYDILVGDVMLIEPGEVIPVDGIIISSNNVKCDESSATGESDLLKKQAADRVMDVLRGDGDADLHKLDPFILSGSKIAEGTGHYLATAVGVNSTYGRTMMSLQEDVEATPLQRKLNVLADNIAKLGGLAALLLFIVLFIKFLVQLKGSGATPAQKGQNFLQIFIVAVTVVVVAVPEGLPLAVTLALAFATTRMLKDNNLVRVLRACETMGNATTVCTDKTGTLTENKMTMVAATVGQSTQLGVTTGTATSTALDGETERSVSAEDEKASEVSPTDFVTNLSEPTKDLILQSIAINSTAFESEDGSEFIGSKTETALLTFARDRMGMGPVHIERDNATIAQVIPFDSGNKYMAAVVKLSSGQFRVYVKGASEILLQKCTRILANPGADISTMELTGAVAEGLDYVISEYASHSLRTIALLFKDFEQWPPAGAAAADDPTQADFTQVFEEMTFVGVVGIKDPLRPAVKQAVKDAQHAGVVIRMVTGDNSRTAEAIAKECGIYTPETGGVVMEGPVFRKLDEAARIKLVPDLQVLARSSPEDKRILVQTLKELDETVAVTGDGTNDAPALKMSDVGFAMGIAGTEVAKEASSIILMDDNFASIIKALMWGRAVNDAVRRFLQFQLTVNITAVSLTFVSAVASKEEESVLSAVQLLWVNLIMDTLAALALATDPPSRKILNRKPDRKSAPLITLNMWKMIVGQAIFQLTATLILHFAGRGILGYDADNEYEMKQLKTLVFNTFVWMQIFNEINNRRLDNHFNIFENLHKNPWFIAITIVMIAGQILIIFVGGEAFKIERITAAQWGISIVIGFVSIPVGAIIRCVPDVVCAYALPRPWRQRLLPDTCANDVEDDDASNLGFIHRIKGGRIAHLRKKVYRMRERAGFDNKKMERMSSVR
ncbi:calcium-translocating P-type ATPase [Eremomyces bilateralis CBS 781.70]|uniref:Calcium-transporting ATPase n=1 Tax=Eremomyces bilateralis CBS 781.70 TaxID=1392243 RepID=A0A6G1G1Z5_9PEZI|nr:calcium-translocating P-type ATPase [Eremomyces bilateralis CBS 781.70]KAF1811946.1 calcium-translocating P-type ATPase [Eremomyces bilateralis CBS 781.70]